MAVKSSYIAGSKPRQRQSGAALIEVAVTIIPLFAFVFLIFDVAWVIFAQSTLQASVRQGVRYAVTCQIASGQTGLDASVRQVVVQNSMGFIQSSKASSLISIKYFSPTTLAQITGSGAIAEGNIVQVSVTGISVTSFGPIMRTATPLMLSATASDVMESFSNGVACSE